MRSICLVGLLLIALGAGFLRWHWHAGRTDVDYPMHESPQADKNCGPNFPRALARTDTTAPINSVPAPAPELSGQERYDAALLDALNLMAERKYPQALAALETARALQDTDLIRSQIDKLNLRIEQVKAARCTIEDIHTVLKDGKVDDAARLAAAGLQQFGGFDNVEELAKLKRQADALSMAQQNDTGARRNRFQIELDVATRDKNLRGAAIALEQLLQLGEDPAVRRQYDDIRATLTRYDENCQRAAELRRDPANLDEAIAVLQEATRAWDTVQVRQEIDDYTLALQKRRDRLSVADFEIRGDVTLPAAGRVVAEELLPAFKCRFALVERSQIARVVDELRLEASELACNEQGQREVGRLAKVRYLVLGSVTGMDTLTVNARLVDVRTGLIVQTAKIVACSPAEMLRLLPQLANVLMMSDEQKMAYEQQLARQTSLAVVPAVVTAGLPPPPEVPAANQPVPPAVVVYTPCPPALGRIRPEDFDGLPLPDQPPPAPVIVVERERRVKNSLLHVSLQLGDNLFRRGRYREAQAHFELALNLSPGHKELSLRLERCRHSLPPAPLPQPEVVVVDPPPPPLRPRIAILNFVVNADPSYAPPGFGDWAAQHAACQFAPTYEVVDRGELFWYMGRLGMSVRDVLTDASARRWLGRALNVRFFVFGVIQQTASFNVSTHLVDAESGIKQGTAQIHVKDPNELKLRMPELAQQTLQNPADQKRLEREAKENEKLLAQARQLINAGKAAQAIPLCQAALKQHPENVAMRVLLQQAEQQVQQQSLEETRRREIERNRAQAILVQERQKKLARDANAARLMAEQEARNRTVAARRAQEIQIQRAHDQLLAQGQQALQQRNYPQAIQLLESALALKPSDAAKRSLVQARAQAAKAAKDREGEDKARRAAELRQQQAAEAGKVRDRIAEERRRQEAAEQARRKALEARDQAAYAKLLDDGKQLLARQQYENALAVLQSARQLRKTSEVEGLIRQAQDKQAHVKIQQSAAAGAAARRREEERKGAAGDAAKKNEATLRAAKAKQLQAYQEAMNAGRTALATKRYDEAIRAFTEAGRLQPNDRNAEALLQQAVNQKNGARSTPPAELKRREEEQRRVADFIRVMAQGQTAFTAKRYEEAVKAFSEAAKLQPNNVAAAKSLRDARQALDASRKARPVPPPAKVVPPARPVPPPAKVVPYPGKVVPPLLPPRAKVVPPARPAPAKVMPPARPVPPPVNVVPPSPVKPQPLSVPQPKPAPAPPPEYLKLMQNADALVKQQKYAEAIQGYQKARTLVPNDPRATQAMQVAEFFQHMAEGQKAMAAKRSVDATREFEAALKIFPGNPAATDALNQAKQGRR